MSSRLRLGVCKKTTLSTTCTGITILDKLPTHCLAAFLGHSFGFFSRVVFYRILILTDGIRFPRKTVKFFKTRIISEDHWEGNKGNQVSYFEQQHSHNLRRSTRKSRECHSREWLITRTQLTINQKTRVLAGCNNQRRKGFERDKQTRVKGIMSKLRMHVITVT